MRKRTEKLQKRFEDWGVYFGDDALKAYKGTSMPFAAYLDLAK